MTFQSQDINFEINQANLSFLQERFDAIDKKLSNIQEYISNDFLSLSYQLRNYNKEIKSVSQNSVIISGNVVGESGNRFIEILDKSYSRLVSINKTITEYIDKVQKELKHFLEYFSNIEKTFDANTLSALELVLSIIKKYQSHLYQSYSNYSESAGRLVSQMDTGVSILKEEHLRAETEVPLLKEKTINCFNNINKLIVDIQFHDITRQRIEHIQEIQNKMLEELSATSSGTDTHLLNILQDVSKLHKLQIEDTKSEWERAYEGIKESLQVIWKETSFMSVFNIDFYDYINYADKEYLDKSEQALQFALNNIENLCSIDKDYDELISVCKNIVEYVENNKQTDIIKEIENSSVIRKINTETAITCSINSIEKGFDILSKEVMNILHPENIKERKETEIQDTKLSAQVSAHIKGLINHIQSSNFLNKVVLEVKFIFDEIINNTEFNNTFSEDEKTELAACIAPGYTMESERVVFCQVFNQDLAELQGGGDDDIFDDFSEDGDDDDIFF